MDSLKNAPIHRQDRGGRLKENTTLRDEYYIYELLLFAWKSKVNQDISTQSTHPRNSPSIGWNNLPYLPV